MLNRFIIRSLAAIAFFYPLFVSADICGGFPPNPTLYFCELPSTVPLDVNGVNNQANDELFLFNGTCTNCPVSGGTPEEYNFPSTLLLEESRSTDVMAPRANVGLPGTGMVKVATVEDYVLKDALRGFRYVFALRVVLDLTVDGTQNLTEFNNFYRTGNTGASVEAAWSEATDVDLRMYKATRSSVLSISAPEIFDPDVVKFQSDINVSEGNPQTGWFYLATDAPCYKVQTNAIKLFQAGEEGQDLLEIDIDGYVGDDCQPDPDPVTTQVPLPPWASWLLLIATLVAGVYVTRTHWAK